MSQCRSGNKRALEADRASVLAGRKRLKRRPGNKGSFQSGSSGTQNRFIEDLRQLLHAGDAGSRGGNEIQVRFHKVGSNLHRVWDSQIIELYTTDERELLEGLKGILIPASTAEGVESIPEDWAAESLQVAKKASCFPQTQSAIQSVTALGDSYFLTAPPLIQMQLAKAGVRVAGMLNEMFK